MRVKGKRFVKHLLLGGGALIALETARRIFRITHLFYPERAPLISWDPQDYGIPPSQVDELWFETDDGEMLYGWYLRAKKPVASALYCHGNTGNLSNPAHVMPHLLDSGINILLFDYRGFGRSEGRPSLNGVVGDTLAAARFHDSLRPKHLPSLLYGYSIGGAIAAKAARRHAFDGLILQSTFSSLPDITRFSFPHVPLHWISGRHFDTVADVKNLDIPLLVIHGTADETCPSWMAHAIYDACGNAMREIHMVEGGLHKDLWMRDPDDLVWVINRFAAGLPRLARMVHDRVPLYERWIDSTLRTMRRHLREAFRPL